VGGYGQLRAARTREGRWVSANDSQRQLRSLLLLLLMMMLMILLRWLLLLLLPLLMVDVPVLL
jgi:hypothetical protein